MDHVEDSAAFLDVAASITGRRWVGPRGDEDRLSEAMAQATDLPPALCRILARRGKSGSAFLGRCEI